MLSSQPFTGFHKKLLHPGLPNRQIRLNWETVRGGVSGCFVNDLISNTYTTDFEVAQRRSGLAHSFCWLADTLIVQASNESSQERAVSGQVNKMPENQGF
jgi:hypothetical protein